MQCVNEKKKNEYFLATEKKYPTLTRVISDINDRLISRQVAAETSEKVDEFKRYMYRNVPTLLISLETKEHLFKWCEEHTEYPMKIMQHLVKMAEHKKI